ncbi:MAG: hypothetical protein WBN81_10060 [Gammaproteobacteria bacterium]
MMNLLARILSHGFAFAVVASIIIVLMYRGEFSAWELPEFLAINGQPRATDKADSGTVDRMVDKAKLPAVTPLASPGSTEEAAAPASAAIAGDEVPSGEGIPAAGGEPDTDSDTTPVTEGETAADIPDVAKPDEGSATGHTTDSPPVEADDEPSMSPPVDRDDSAAQTTDDASAQTGDETTDENGSPVAAAPATAVKESSDGSMVQPSDDTMATMEDAAADQAATMLEPAPVAVTEDAAPAEVIPSVTEASAPAAVKPPVMEAPAPAAVKPPVMEVPAPAAVMPPVMEAPAPAEATSPVDEELAPAAGSIPAAKPLTTAPNRDPAPATSEKPYEVMAKAREAFWLRDFELAEQQYRKLTQLEPDNPDGYGELGNMYFSQGKWDESAAAYYQAGTRLLNEGLVQEARQMVDVIRGLNGAQADDLEVQINAVSSSSP